MSAHALIVTAVGVGCSAWLGILPLTIWLIVLGGWWCSIIENRRKDQAAMPEKDRKPPGLKM